MTTPQLYRQLFEQLRQWIVPEDRRHLQGYAEIIAAILLSGSACLSHWLPYLSHRDCQARSHLERLSYFIHNPAIVALAILCSGCALSATSLNRRTASTSN